MFSNAKTGVASGGTATFDHGSIPDMADILGDGYSFEAAGLENSDFYETGRPASFVVAAPIVPKTGHLDQAPQAFRDIDPSFATELLGLTGWQPSFLSAGAMVSAGAKKPSPDPAFKLAATASVGARATPSVEKMKRFIGDLNLKSEIAQQQRTALLTLLDTPEVAQRVNAIPDFKLWQEATARMFDDYWQVSDMKLLATGLFVLGYPDVGCITKPMFEGLRKEIWNEELPVKQARLYAQGLLGLVLNPPASVSVFTNPTIKGVVVREIYEGGNKNVDSFVANVVQKHSAIWLGLSDGEKLVLLKLCGCHSFWRGFLEKTGPALVEKLLSEIEQNRKLWLKIDAELKSRLLDVCLSMAGNAREEPIIFAYFKNILEAMKLGAKLKAEDITVKAGSSSRFGEFGLMREFLKAKASGKARLADVLQNIFKLFIEPQSPNKDSIMTHATKHQLLLRILEIE